MKKLAYFSQAIFFVVSCALALYARAQDDCPYSLEFQTIKAKLDTLSPIEAAQVLRGFASKNQSTQTCEAIAINQSLEKQEKQLITLLHPDKTSTPAHAVFRCNVFNSKTTQCQSPMEDTTVHANQANVIAPLLKTQTGAFHIESHLAGTTLHSVYVTTINKALDGKPAKRLRGKNNIKGSSLVPSTVLIVIYQTSDSWAYRKAVWYF